MIPAFTFYPLVLLVNAALLILIALYVQSKKTLPGASYFSLLMFCAAIWSLAGSHEASVYGAGAKILSSQVSYMGIAFVGMLWFLFSLEFSGYSKKAIAVLRIVLLLVPLCILFLVFNNASLGIVWPQTFSDNPLDPYSPVIYTHGWGFYLNMGYQYILLFAGTVVLLIHALKSESKVRNQLLSTIIALAFPWVANILYISQAQRVGDYDLTPFTFMFTGIFIALGLFRYKFFNPVPATQNLLYDVLGHGIVIVDQHETIVEMNNIAFQLFPNDLRLGIVLAELKSDDLFRKITFQALQDKKPVFFSETTSKWVKVDCILLDNQWNLLVFYDFSFLHDKYETLRKNKEQLGRVVNFLADPAYVVSPTNEIVVWNTSMQQLTRVPATTLVGTTIPKELVLFAVSHGKGEVEFEGKIFVYEKRPLVADKEVIGNLVYFKDVTDIKTAEIQLKERVKTLESLQFIMKKREKRLAQEIKKKGNQLSKPVAVPWHNT